VLGMLWFRSTGSVDSGTADRYLSILFLQSPRDAAGVVAGAAAAGMAASLSLGKLFLFFLKVGSVLYGSGYVLIAFLEGGLVRDFGWLTPTQLLDAVAIGQFTPGPVLSTATFVGYVVDGWAGAGVATLGIFLPSFLFVLMLNPIIPRMRRSAWLSAFLDAVNVAALALMVAVTLELAVGVLTSWPAWLIAIAAAVLALRFRVNAAWLVLGGAVLGWLLAR
jgi:chromate transporter